MIYTAGKLLVGWLVCCGLLLVATGAGAKSVTLQWDANTDPTVAGYKIYYKVGTGGAPFNGTGASEGPSPVTVGKNTTKVLNGLSDSQTYTFSVTAYDAAGFESDYSNSVTSLAAAADSAPVISGTPATSVNFGSAYSFRPTASDPNGHSLTFSIANKPAWASFSTRTGVLAGTPTLAQAGTTHSIVISVSDGFLSASLAAFSLTVVGDVAAPTTTVSPAAGIYANQVTVSLRASDNTDPAAKIYYTTNGSTPTTASAQYSAPLQVTSSTTVKFMARDAWGNQSAIQNAAYTITIPDTSAPTTTVSPAAGTYANQATVTLRASDNTDPAAKIYYTTNGSTPTTASAQYHAPLQLTTSTTVKFMARDASGNQSAVKSSAYTITQTPVTNSGLSFVAADTALPGVTRADGGSVTSNLDTATGKPMIDVGYTFRVVYQDTSGTGASNSVYLVLNGYAFPMTKGSGNLATGASYSYDTWLGPASAWRFHYEVRDGSGNLLFRLPQDGEQKGPRVRLLNGGNFLGVAKNLATAATTPSQAFGAGKAFAWTTSASGLGRYEAATLIDAGKGYYVNDAGPGPLPALVNIPEQEAASVSISLTHGWNIVSNPYGGNVRLSDVLVKKGSQSPVSWTQASRSRWLADQIYYYPGSDWNSSNGFETAGGPPDAKFAPWIGYWVYLIASDGPYSLILPKPAK